MVQGVRNDGESSEVLTLEDISRGSALSPSKLNRICNELVGESPVSYFTYLNQ